MGWTIATIILIITTTINECDKRLKQIDDKNIFHSDDEIGWFFTELKKIQEALNEFTLK
jgi:hypothetical protein